jgi:hypothetical protein
MIEEEDIDGLAAEYVLGSLDAAERRQVESRSHREPALAQAIAAWERRLSPLSAREPGLSPPAHLLDGILERIARAPTAAASGSARVVPFSRPSQRRWRMMVGGSALAACLAVLFGWLAYFEPGGPSKMDCGGLYKTFWETRDQQKYANISAEQLAGVSRMALRAYDACQAGDEQDAKALFERLGRSQF